MAKPSVPNGLSVAGKRRHPDIDRASGRPATETRLGRWGKRAVLALALSLCLPVAGGSVRAADTPEAGRAPTRPTAFRIDRVGAHDLTVFQDGQIVLTLSDGHLARFRCTPANDHWLGTRQFPVDLAWCPNRSFGPADVSAVSAQSHPDGFQVVISGRRPELPHTRFNTRIEGTLDTASNSLRYRIRSSLNTEDSQPLKDRIGSLIEFLDVWVEGLFWPECDEHDRELYPWIVFGKADGALLKAPKLHVFPSLPGATYETLVQTIERGGDFAIIDPLEPGYRLRFTNLSSPAIVGICWWTWDPHFFFRPTAKQTSLEYEVEIDAISVGHGRQLLKRATPILFRKDPDYELPVFRRDRVNTFQKLIDRSDEWAWEPHSRRCGVDRTTGAGDRQCVTIQSKGQGRTAWYTRAIGRDYFDHRTLKGRYRVTAEARTQAVSGAARLGVVCYNGPETKLYAEPAHQAFYSRPVRGTSDWTPLSVEFDSEGFTRFKIILEQDGSGQSWFDNVTFLPIPTSGSPDIRVDQLVRTTEEHPLDWRPIASAPGRHRLDFDMFSTSRLGVRSSDGRLTLAWERCVAKSPHLRLAPGSYQFVLRASADGCPGDRPRLLAEIPGMPPAEIQVDPDRTAEYVVRFALAEEDVVHLSLTFLNDGSCAAGSGTVDKNVYIHEIWLESIRRAAR